MEADSEYVPRTTHPAGNFLRGLAMGTVDVIPGVSGGTMALITGIYERLVQAVRHATSILVALVGPGSAKEEARRTDWGLLLPVVLGMISAILVASAFIPHLLETYPTQMRALFFGLIVASIPVPWSMIDRRTPTILAVGLVSAVLTYMLVGLPTSELEHPALWYVFVTAAVAICAMVLPGISGAFLLYVLGTYEPTLEALNDRNIGYVAVFCAGVLVGITGFSRILSWLLERWHALTLAVLAGLMVGSLRKLWPWLEDERFIEAPSGSAAEIALVVGIALAGFLVITALLAIERRNARLRG